MEAEINELGQPVGLVVSGWKAAQIPPREPMNGRFCRLEPLDEKRHGDALWQAYSEDAEGALWTYLGVGPMSSPDELFTCLRKWTLSEDMIFFAICEAGSGEAVGVASYLRIFPREGSIEVGNLCFAPRLQKTPAATEAMYLMMKRAFELGYRRYEWKCNDLNEPSRKAAVRLGFTYEGTFRQAVVVKGRNRDTAWFSVIDGEWPRLRRRFEKWLAEDNFDERGRQRVSLSTL